MNVVILKRADRRIFAIYRYIIICSSLWAAWVIPGGQRDMGDNSCDACECCLHTAVMSVLRAIPDNNGSDYGALPTARASGNIIEATRDSLVNFKIFMIFNFWMSDFSVGYGSIFAIRAPIYTSLTSIYRATGVVAHVGRSSFAS